ncbi:MAG: helix-turn-helix transcriptional regulator [Alphaproteobacteria bacterium]|nr:helix-turn-helix transcriptional regulator [Alphaproteobacteria bacterium]
MVVLIDAKYFGSILRKARRENKMNTKDVAKMFGVRRRELLQYEHGTKPISESLLMSLFYYGFCLKRCKKNCN